MEINDKTRNIPSLDGMRAISILLVIVAHTSQNFARWIRIPVGSYLLFAHTGVSVFFVISGFLITSLLLKELDATGTIAIKRFYLRRAFRIFPPFYFYLAIIFVLALVGVFPTPLRAFFFAATYTSDYYLGPGPGPEACSISGPSAWRSSSIFFGRPRCFCWGNEEPSTWRGFSSSSHLFRAPSPTLFWRQPHRAMVGRMFHSSIDTIMFGCLLALLWDNDRFIACRRAWMGAWADDGRRLVSSR